MATLLISIDRSGMAGAPAPLVLSGSDDANPLGVTNYAEPPRQARVTYYPDSRDAAGSKAQAATWQQSILAFDVMTDQAADEAASRTLLQDLQAAIGQFAYTVTVTVGNAPAQVWKADMGSMAPTGSRTVDDLDDADPEWTVTIPVYPIPS